MSKRPAGRPKTRWEDVVLEDVRRVNVRSWKNAAQNRVLLDSWIKVVENLIQGVSL
jgi:hypothetical protein